MSARHVYRTGSGVPDLDTCNRFSSQGYVKDTGCDFRARITPGVLAQIDYRDVEAGGGPAGSIRSKAP
jgi:hypothetical protein